MEGYDFNNGIDYSALLASYRTSGFQATNFGKAVEEINKMVNWNCNIVNLKYVILWRYFVEYIICVEKNIYIIFRIYTYNTFWLMINYIICTIDFKENGTLA